MKGTIAVYVRHIDEGDGQLLGHFLPSQIYQLPKLFERFDCHSISTDTARFTHAQFVSAEGNVYFEIVVEQISNEA